MAIQFLLVTYPEERAVYADGVGVGFTNHMLMLPADEYLITLGGGDYRPASQDIVLSGTSQIKPLVLPFSPVAPAAPAVIPGTAGTSAAVAPASDQHPSKTPATLVATAAMPGTAGLSAGISPASDPGPSKKLATRATKKNA
jgi:hypothetical protein